jgi:predicted acyltransferase
METTEMTTATADPHSDLVAALRMPTPPAELPPASRRLQSLDVFRGLTIAGMILVNNPWHEPDAYAPLKHSLWHGWTPTDLIFPFFMFIMGVAMPFSFAKRRATTEQTRVAMFGRIWVRALALIMLGMCMRAALGQSYPKLPDGFSTVQFFRYAVTIFAWTGTLALLIPWRSKFMSNWLAPILAILFLALAFTLHVVSHHATDAGLSPEKLGGGLFRPEMMRIPGVLQRLGVCYGIAGTFVLFFGPRMLFAWSVILLALYATLMFTVPFHNEFTGKEMTGSLTKADNAEHAIDVRVLDRFKTGIDGKPMIDGDGKLIYTSHHTYGEYADPEGILSTIPATVTPMLGAILGIWLRRQDRNVVEKSAGMLAVAVVVTLLGVALDSWLMPINKKIWTPSFVVFTAGTAMLGLGAIFWLIDVRGRGKWLWPFKVLGMNAIAALVGSEVIDHVAHLVTIHPPSDRGGIELASWVNKFATSHVQDWSDRLRHLTPHLPTLATPANLSMIYPITLILATLLLMWVLYALKIFVKV